jgi:hypothetical protein
VFKINPNKPEFIMNARPHRLLLGVILLLNAALENPRLTAQQDQPQQTPAIQVSQPHPALSHKDEPVEAPSDRKSHSFRIKSIEQRIDIIKEVMRNKQAAAKAATEAASLAERKAAAEPAPGADESIPAGKSSSTLADSSPSPNPPKAHAVEAANSGSPMTTDSGAEEKGHSNTKPAIDPLESIDIGTSPLNSMELANSLFITGHYAQATRGYETLMNDKTLATLDSDWLRCLAANCYRAQGQIAAAEKLYREVVASREKSYASNHAKWYLDHLTRKKKIRAELDALQAELQSTEKQASKPEN